MKGPKRIQWLENANTHWFKIISKFFHYFCLKKWCCKIMPELSKVAKDDNNGATNYPSLSKESTESGTSKSSRISVAFQVARFVARQRILLNNARNLRHCDCRYFYFSKLNSVEKIFLKNREKLTCKPTETSNLPQPLQTTIQHPGITSFVRLETSIIAMRRGFCQFQVILFNIMYLPDLTYYYKI